MSKSKKPPVMQSVLGYEIAYPEMLQYEKLQMENYWTPSEPKVENDEHSLRSGVLTAAELHGVITASKLFVLYEVHVGTDYWSGRFSRMFPRPEFRRVAAVNSMVEMNIHAPFYKLINEILNIDTPEFYVSYTQSPVLKARMDHIESIVRDKNDLVSLGAFSMIEGAILYSSFAFFLHFQQNGKNKLKAFNSGIEFSVRDENCHSMAGAHAFRIALRESIEHGLMTKSDVDALHEALHECAITLFEHESHIIDMLFEKGEISGITKEQLKTFVESRLNLCLSQLGVPTLFIVDENTNAIAKWFYPLINMASIHDFFAKLGSQYSRGYSPSAFTLTENLKFIG